jgi:phenylpropionate dioxygenase-like ring-hydroxylating dioxygenase large terminal subunit
VTAEAKATAAAPGSPELAEGLRRALAYHWHPVCRTGDLPGPVAVRLLGRDLVVARLGGDDGPLLVADDRCPHRSVRLSIGTVEGDCLRCAYHGWAYDAGGRCVDIPSLPGGPIPERALTPSYEAEARYGLVWVRLDAGAGTAVPACPAFDDPAMKVLPGEPYTWPVSALRRVENFVDLAHFAFVHDGTLGRRDEPVPPIPDVARTLAGDHSSTEGAELRFNYDPPAYPEDMAATAMLASSRYRMPMPCTVDIEFLYPDGRRRQLWMTASPLDDEASRSFWYVCRTDDLAGDDRDHLAFQAVVTAEDEPVVSAHVPAALPLETGAELSVRTDKVSIEYRRWLKELALAALSGPSAYAGALGVTQRREHSA